MKLDTGPVDMHAQHFHFPRGQRLDSPDKIYKATARRSLVENRDSIITAPRGHDMRKRHYEAVSDVMVAVVMRVPPFHTLSQDKL